MKKKFTRTHKKAASEDPVKAKKHLGQHFLKDESIAKKIAETLSYDGYSEVLEIGPGTGVLTKYLLRKDSNVTAMDLDSESIVYLNHSFPLEHPQLMEGCTLNVVEADFLKFDLSKLFGDQAFAITGNFPYNISTQIVFKMLEWRDQVPEFSGMFQKEVAQRICEKEGSKAYGILSVLAQAFYDAEYLLYKVVKMAFQQRRKTLRNSLKQLELSDAFRESEIFNMRPEQLSVEAFIKLTQDITNDKAGRS